MDLVAIQQALALMATPFVRCHTQIPAILDGNCAYVDMHDHIEVNTTLAGSHIVSIPIVALFSRNDDQAAQTNLSTLLSSGLLDAFDQPILDENDDPITPPWMGAMFTTVAKPRIIKLGNAETGEEVIAVNINIQLSTLPST